MPPCNSKIANVVKPPQRNHQPKIRIATSLAAAEKIVNQDLVMVIAIGAEIRKYLVIFRLVVLIHHPALLHRLITDLTDHQETS